jgi:hypothetical protein
MIGLILTLAICGLIVWAIITYIPMPPIFKNAILIIVAICVILYLIQAFGVADIPIPRLNR